MLCEYLRDVPCPKRSQEAGYEVRACLECALDLTDDKPMKASCP